MNYVAGFLFNDSKTHVALIKKERPEWQRGLLNGVGGKVEPTDDSPLVSIQREFFEEVGVMYQYWRYFMILQGTGWKVFFFKAFNSAALNKVRPCTDEKPEIIKVSELHKFPVIPNLHWIIPMALEKDGISNIYYEILEKQINV